MTKKQPKNEILTPEQEKQIAEERLQANYRTVFGVEGSRNIAQKAVFLDLARQGYRYYGTVNKDGNPMLMSHSEGRRSLFLYIESMVTNADDITNLKD